MAAGNLHPHVATPHDLDAVVAILVSAFHDDPTWSWAFPDPRLRAQQHTQLWGLFVQGALRYPWVWLTHGDTATSVWIPPEGTDLSDEQEAALEPNHHQNARYGCAAGHAGVRDVRPGSPARSAALLPELVGDK